MAGCYTPGLPAGSAVRARTFTQYCIETGYARALPLKLLSAGLPPAATTRPPSGGNLLCLRFVNRQPDAEAERGPKLLQG